MAEDGLFSRNRVLDHARATRSRHRLQSLWTIVIALSGLMSRFELRHCDGFSILRTDQTTIFVFRRGRADADGRQSSYRMPDTGKHGVSSDMLWASNTNLPLSSEQPHGFVLLWRYPRVLVLESRAPSRSANS